VNIHQRVLPTFLILFVAVLVALVGPHPARAEHLGPHTQDVNHKGWETVYDEKTKRDIIVVAHWIRITTLCDPCKFLARTYNNHMQKVFFTRWQITQHDQDERRFISEVRAKLDKYKEQGVDPTGDSDAARDVAKTLGDLSGAPDAFDEARQVLRSEERALMRRAQKLRDLLAECERQCKPANEPTLVAGIGDFEGLGSDPLPEITAMQVPFPWAGPYPAVCYKCAKLAERLNNLYDWARRAQLDIDDFRRELTILRAELKLRKAGYGLEGVRYTEHEIRDAEKGIENRQNRIEGYKRNFDATLKLYQDCIKTCEKKVSYCPKPPAHVAMVVGPNDEVGTGGKRQSDLRGRMMGGLMGGGASFGGGSRRGGFGSFGGGDSQLERSDTSNDGPKTADDPTSGDFAVAKNDGVELGARGMMTNDGLLISTKILEDGDKGTFQTAYLEDIHGRRMVPYRIDIYILWMEWELTITWTYTKTADGKVVERRSRTWKTGGRVEETLAVYQEGKAVEESIWKRKGFSHALKGMRSIGLAFPIKVSDLDEGPINLVTFVTRPDKDPVMAVPMIYVISRDPSDEKKILIKPAKRTLAADRHC
jgi:hypothetical protein